MSDAWLLKHCTCYGAPNEDGYVDLEAGPEQFELMTDDARPGAFCSWGSMCKDSAALEAEVARLRAAMEDVREDVAYMNTNEAGKQNERLRRFMAALNPDALAVEEE